MKSLKIMLPHYVTSLERRQLIPWTNTEAAFIPEKSKGPVGLACS